MNFSVQPHGQHKNLTGLTVVGLLHLLLFVLVLSGSKLTVFKAAPAEIELTPTKMAPPVPPLEPEPLPQPQAAPPDIFVPPLETVVMPTTTPPVTVRTLTDQPPAQTNPPGVPDGTQKAPPAMAAPAHVAAVVDSQACAKPDYPKNALRNGDTGVVTLSLLVGTDGRVADSKVEKTSGFRELDRAAQVGLGLCKFKPGTLDGVPYQSWTKMQYVWSLND